MEKMKKDKVFVFRLSEEDSQELEAVAKTIQRSKSGTLRYALREIARVVREHPDKTKLIRSIRAS